jgi:8-oxo-dGTP pyrophosphatase MutT (NUDIX family)
MVKLRLVKALVRCGGEYLVLRKAQDRYFPDNINGWECPGGIIDEFENPEEAILRKTKEETGLDVQLKKELAWIRMTNENDSLCGVYLLESPEQEEVILSPEHSNHLWVYPNEVKNMNLVRYASLLLEFFNNPERYLE